MKRLLKFVGYFFLGIIGLILLAVAAIYINFSIQSSRNQGNFGEAAPELTDNGFSYRDLNKNGQLDPYEDSRKSTETRVEDLLSQMNLEEKAGLMFITIIANSGDGSIMDMPSPSNPFSFLSPTNSFMLGKQRMNHFNIFATASPIATATWHNNIQQLAERTRLGIPVTIGSDPRHAFSQNIGANLSAEGYSQWCEPIGFGAIGDSMLVKEFGDMARQEYLATGIRLALHPMADLATEPRWARTNGTFGEDAHLSAEMTKAYILGFQGDTLNKQSVACMTKHFSGGGPQKDGLDAHFFYGADQAYPGNNFDYHLIPFDSAFAVHTAQIMPYYGIPVGQSSEDVGFAFNKDILTGLLRNQYGFDGVICSDWGILTDRKVFGMTMMLSTGWGVDDLSPSEKALKALDAGIDQFGGESSPELLIQLVKEGKLTEDRLDVSVRRLLRDKFTLGLFDNPYVDLDKVARVVGQEAFVKAGELSQRKAIVLLKNGKESQAKMLPISGSLKVYAEGISADAIQQYGGTLVDQPEQADVAILRLQTPWVPRSGGKSMLENFFHQGDLDFKGEEKDRILHILNTVPTIVDIYMDRPAVIPEIAASSAALLANFGASDEALLDILYGRFEPSGTLPFELASSMEAVENQKEDVPYDSHNPLFEFGFGLTYSEGNP
ncbi:MAG: glycoside hydrolase family 3 N-terminal domain-containing protein [Bacteroidota bacterium]